MAKEVLLYEQIYSYSAKEFIKALDEASSDNLKLRINCKGGDVHLGWGTVAKWAEHQKSKVISVDGVAASFGAYFLCYTDYAECLDVSDFLLHRAAFDSYYEDNFMSESDKKWLIGVNKKLREAFEAKVDVAKFEEISGTTVDEMFSMKGRIDVILTAEEAKDIGLIQKINPITPALKAEIGAKMKIAASVSGDTGKNKGNKSIKNTKMDIEKLKAEHPSVYGEVLKLGAEQEKERVQAWMSFLPIDSDSVTKGINEGSQVTQKVMAEMTVKGMSATALKALTAENADDLDPPDPETKEKTEKEKLVADFDKEVMAHLNIQAS